MTDYDVVTIGSGFGGAITSCRLAEAGYKVLILERGRNWQKADYPRQLEDAWVWSQSQPERFNGWIDFRVFQKMAVIQGAAVGGGSQIYSGISVDASPDLLEQGWPPEITFEELKPHYQQVGAMLNLHKIPENQFPERTQLLQEAAEKAGFGANFEPLDLAISFNQKWHYGLDDPFDEKHSEEITNAQGLTQGTCIHLGTCNIGCQVRAKNTLDLNYIPRAKENGAELRALHVVRLIEPLDDGSGYRVYFDQIDQEQLNPGQVTARIVIVAAGSLGSTELMLRCRDEYRTLPNLSQVLGRGWSGNGDVISTAFYPNRLLHPGQGPTTTAAVNFLGPNNQNGNHFFIEDAGFPNVLRLYLEQIGQDPKANIFIKSLLSTLQLSLQHSRVHNLGDLELIDHIMPWFAQGRDAADGQLYLRKKWLVFGQRILDLKWDISQSAGVINAIKNMHEMLTARTGGNFMEPFYWTFNQYLVTTHPLGGCPMGQSHDEGVVNHKGEVFAYKNLYIADGAIIPKAIGANPSKTIAALAERIAKIIIDEKR